MLVPAGLGFSFLCSGKCIVSTQRSWRVYLPWFGIDLGKLGLMGSHGFTVVVEDQKASTGRALVDGPDESLRWLHLRKYESIGEGRPK